MPLPPPPPRPTPTRWPAPASARAPAGGGARGRPPKPRPGRPVGGRRPDAGGAVVVEPAGERARLRPGLDVGGAVGLGEPLAEVLAEHPDQPRVAVLGQQRLGLGAPEHEHVAAPPPRRPGPAGRPSSPATSAGLEDGL